MERELEQFACVSHLLPPLVAERGSWCPAPRRWWSCCQSAAPLPHRAEAVLCLPAECILSVHGNARAESVSNRTLLWFRVAGSDDSSGGQ